MIYKANHIENAVIRIDKIHKQAFAKLIDELQEYEVSITSDMVLGSFDYHNIPYEITKKEYDTFGIKWKFGVKERETVTI